MNKNIKILVVNNENKTEANVALTTTLTNINMQNVLTVNSVKEAIQVFVDANETSPFDVTLLHELNDEDEIGLIKSLIEINPEQYVVVLTDSILPEKVLNCIRAGASGLLNKPFSAEKLRLELDKYSFLHEDKKTVSS